MSNFQILALLLIFCYQSHWQAPRPPIKHVFKCDVKSSCSAKPKKRHSMEIETKLIGPKCALHIWKISIGPSPIWIGWMHVSEYLTPLEYLWVYMNANEWVLNIPWTSIKCTRTPISEYWTAPEHLLSVYDHQRLSVNTQRVRMTAIKLFLNATHRGVTMRKIIFVSELNTPWMIVSTCECLWVSIEHPLNACGCMWMPISEYWTPPEYPLSVYECQWVSGNSPWTSIECAWMPLSMYFNGHNAHL
jgi:hypothetical protein